MKLFAIINNKRFFFASFISLFSIIATAEIDSKYLLYGSSCTKQSRNNYTSVNMFVADAIYCKSMYGQVQYLEIAVANSGFQKNIFLVDRTYGDHAVVQIKSWYLKNSSEISAAPSGATLYLGVKYGGYDVFLVTLNNPYRSPNAKFDIYVNFNNRNSSDAWIKDLDLFPLKK